MQEDSEQEGFEDIFEEEKEKKGRKRDKIMEQIQQVEAGEDDSDGQAFEYDDEEDGDEAQSN